MPFSCGAFRPDGYAVVHASPEVGLAPGGAQRRGDLRRRDERRAREAEEAKDDDLVIAANRSHWAKIQDAWAANSAKHPIGHPVPIHVRGRIARLPEHEERTEEPARRLPYLPTDYKAQPRYHAVSPYYNVQPVQPIGPVSRDYLRAAGVDVGRVGGVTAVGASVGFVFPSVGARENRYPPR